MSASEPTPPRATNGSWYHSQAPERSRAVIPKLSTGRPAMVHWLYVENKSTTKFYLFAFEGTDTTGTLAHAPIPVESHGFGSFDCRYAIPVIGGLFLAISSSDATFTQVASDDAWFSVGYHRPVAG